MAKIQQKVPLPKNLNKKFKDKNKTQRFALFLTKIKPTAK